MSMNINDLRSKIEVLQDLVHKLLEAPNLQVKIAILDDCPEVGPFLENSILLKKLMSVCSPEGEFVIKSILAIGQGPVVFHNLEHLSNPEDSLKSLIQCLWEVESFYNVIGGVVGYHLTFLTLVSEAHQSHLPTDKMGRFTKPPGIDMTQQNERVNQAIFWGLKSLPEMAEIYPVGGAGDRLNLTDEKTGALLPVAELRFKGISLLKGLIHDLQAKEWLYYKVFGKQVTTPILMMTSYEKENYAHILDICARNKWFGRPSELFFFIIQPLVPVISEEGQWVMSDILHLSLKPGGHGVVWKLASDRGAIDWLISHKRTKALVRQINNPIAGTDYGLLAFAGFGCKEQKSFGFASCPRQLRTAEGMDILIENQVENGYEYRISNVEYTDFAKRNIQDVPEYAGSNYSVFPANTNILFADLNVVAQKAIECPLPGMLINLKPSCTGSGKASRLESTMQNISDFIVDKFSNRLKPDEYGKLSTFLTYNERRKTISVTKRSFDQDKPVIETPEGCFFDLMLNNHQLLKHYCGMDMHEMCSEANYIEQGPTYIILYHPALGPLYSVISEKLNGGMLKPGAEIQLDIAEVDIKNLHLNGSLIIQADSPIGKLESDGIIRYSEKCGKCELLNVTVENKGIDRSANNIYWKNQIARKEFLYIILHGNAEFYAENVHFQRSHTIDVPDGHRCEARETNGVIHFKMSKIQSHTWMWKYSFEDTIRLQKVECGDKSPHSNPAIR